MGIEQKLIYHATVKVIVAALRIHIFAASLAPTNTFEGTLTTLPQIFTFDVVQT